MDNLKFIDDVKKMSESGVKIELESHYLLGETDAFDDFEPANVDVKTASPYDIFRLACCKYVGFKTQEDEKFALDLWKEASCKGELNSCVEYSAYFFKKGSVKEGLSLLVQASKLGNSTAIFRLALCYISGVYIQEDLARGVKLMKLLADKNYGDALFYMSTIYLLDLEDFPYDEAKSEMYLNKAAKLKSKFALTEYGYKTLITSKNLEKKKEAFAMLKESADVGEPRAMTLIAVLYAKGMDGVFEVSEELSKVYLSLACDLGYAPAISLFEEIKKNAKN